MVEHYDKNNEYMNQLTNSPESPNRNIIFTNGHYLGRINKKMSIFVIYCIHVNLHHEITLYEQKFCFDKWSLLMND